MIRLLLKEHVSEANVATEASHNNWLWWDLIERNNKNPYEVIWITKDKKTSIHYIYDHLIALRYLVVRGDKEEEITEQAKASLAVYSRGDIFSMVQQASSLEMLIQSVYHVAIAAPEKYDSEFFRLFEGFLSSSSVELRRATILAIAYVSWSEFRPLLENIKSNDVDAEVRTNASLVADGLKEQS